MSAALVKATLIYVEPRHVICPHCGAEVDGWCNDPRGVETECDECQLPFVVATGAEVKLV